jgi:miniconductance mechanosensitive channel
MGFDLIADQIRDFLMEHGFYGERFNYAYLVLSALILGAFSFLVWHIIRLIMIFVVKTAVTKSKTTWDDKLFEFRVFRALSMILIAVIFVYAVPIVLKDFPKTRAICVIIAQVYVVLTIMFAINAILNAIVNIMEETETYRDKPIRSYKQVAKIVFYMVGFVMILAIIIGRSPLYILGGFGAVTAVLLLIFRDPILGFVASIQMSAVDLVRLGDWITVEKYGADGEVTEINLTTIKVRNWDMTVTIVPAYALVSESFRNWRGMEESDGRRIKKFISIKISSIKFCDEILYNKLLGIQLLKEYLENRNKEIEIYNEENNIDRSILINGRNMTNIGIFRLYAEKYLAHNPLINTNMIFMVRQLQPTENGLPIEIYAFSKEKELENYEAVAADIFDHLLATVPFFELEIFQSPSGSDLRGSGYRVGEEQGERWQERT